MFYKMHIIDLKNDDSEFPAIEVTRYAFWPIQLLIFVFSVQMDILCVERKKLFDL